jgi:hypothetical protein
MITKRLFSKKVLKANSKALEIYDFYKETVSILKNTGISSNNKPHYHLASASIINCDIDTNGNNSTQKIR